jgi:tRNA pseudouridine38-40 synthase
VRDGLDSLFSSAEGLAVAGRTDTGVHALGNVVSVGVTGGPPVDRAGEALNTVLPDDVAVVAAEEAPADFHARFSARSR